MSTQRKRLYLSLMIIGGLALVADRLVGLGDATVPSLAQASEETAPAALDQASTVPIPDLPFPRELEPIAADAVIPDIFARPKTSSRPASSDNEASDRARAPSPNHLSAAEFIVAHQLNGLRVNKRLKIANVDGRWVGSGALISGCKLSAITTHNVVFECYDEEAALSLGNRHPVSEAKVQSGAGR